MRTHLPLGPRVLHIPAAHPYVVAVTPVGAGAVPAGEHAGLRVEWLRDNRSRFDVLHLHFGFDLVTPVRLRAWLDAVRDLDVPLVHTVHDLRNPHHATPGPQREHQDLLIPAVDRLITLTPGAADAVERCWGVRPVVVPHPPILTGPPVARTAPGATVGIHLKDLRRNVVRADRVVAAAARGARSVGGRLRVDVHPGVRDRPEVRRIAELARAGVVDLHVHERFSDRELMDYLAGLDVTVLPYRWGSHSGWLEAGRDVGTRVVAPSCGFYHQQWDDVVGYRHDEGAGLDEESLAAAVATALSRPAPTVADAAGRRARRDLVRTVHADLYQGLAGRARVAA